MNVIIIGASKGIGSQTVKTALAAGHTVTAFSRRPERLSIQHPRLRLEAGDVLDAPLLARAIAGHDAVICTLGLPSLQAMGPPFARRSYVLSKGVGNILQVMSAQGIRRFICVTAIGTGESTSQCTPLAQLVLRRGLRWLFQEKDRQELLIKSSGLNWTIVRPSALTNGKLKGARVGEELRAGILTQVSRADVAGFLVEILDQPKTSRKALVISYPPRLGDSVRWVAGYFMRYCSHHEKSR